MILRGRTMFDPCLGDANTHAPHMCQFPYHAKPKYSQETKEKIRCSFRFFFCTCRRKRKSYQKENAEIRFHALRSATTAVGGRHRLPQKAGENFNYGGGKL